MRRSVAVVLGLVVSLARPAAASVDVTGSWVVILQSIVGPLTGTFDFVQTGTQLQLTYTIQGGGPAGPYDGTIDPETGVFAVPLPDTVNYIVCTGNQITGTASPDSQSISGYWTSYFVNIHLFCQDGGGPFTGVRARCGDGVVESGEACDDGNVVDGDCCSADCLSATPDGTTCDDGNACTLGDQCSAGRCSPSSELSCDPCKTCSPGGCIIAEDGGCEPVRAGGKSSILLHHTAGAPQKDAFTWKWTNGSPMTVADFGQPGTTDAYFVCVIDRTGGVPTLRMSSVAALSGGGFAGRWKSHPNGFTYTSPDGAPQGLTGLTLKAGDVGKGKLAAKGKGALLSMPDGGFTAPVTVRLQRYYQPQKCWDAKYSTPHTNDGTVFRAKSD